MYEMRVHFIAVGGAVMHNLAVALHKKGYHVTGSDDEIFEPARSVLASYGLLPPSQGWHPERITSETDSVILGMHARADNPELRKALELGLKIMSFPEYIYDQTKNKKRIVVAGSHGKTTITGMIMHVFRKTGMKFDYMMGSRISGFDTMVSLSDDSVVAVLEGDEYLTSALDKRPKFHIYMPDTAILNGIAWDHMNVFPEYGNYVEQFRIFAGMISDGGTLIYFEDDPEVKRIALSAGSNIKKTPYRVHGYFQNRSGFFGATHNRVIPLKIFGEHNMQNLSAAKEACVASGISEDDFYDAISDFEGAYGRLRKIFENENGTAFSDFAHSPSKVKATVEAVAERYPCSSIIACLELHTYSSLNSAFLPLYRGTLAKAAAAYICFNPHSFEIKKLEPLSEEAVAEAFGGKDIKVFSNPEAMFMSMKSLNPESPVYLFMSSGDFDGSNLKEISEELLGDK